jgi:hypothetical protein
MRFALALAAIALFVIAGCSGGTGGTGSTDTGAGGDTAPAATDVMTDTTGTGG